MSTTPTAAHAAEQGQQPRGGGQTGGADGGRRVRVRYFAGAAAAAGVDEEVVLLPVGGDLAALRERMVDLHPPLQRVLAVATLLVDEVASADDGLVLRDDAQVDVLPPFAGG